MRAHAHRPSPRPAAGSLHAVDGCPDIRAERSGKVAEASGGWRRAWALARRTVRAFFADDVTGSAAGVAFFVLLAVFPGLAALVSIVQLFGDPSRIEALIATVSDILPGDAVEIVERQIARLVAMRTPDEDERRALALTPYFGFAILVWGANKGTKALFRALNRIYGREESRSFLVFILITLGFTLAALAFLVFALAAVLGLPVVLDALGLSVVLGRTLELLRWPVLLTVVGCVVGLIYRFAPSGRRPCSWRSIALGSLVAALLWIGGSLLFSWFVTTFGRMDELYGSLSAVIGFMVWVWLSIIAVLVGAEVDAAAEAMGREATEG